jgi:hypothetical protein
MEEVFASSQCAHCKMIGHVLGDCVMVSDQGDVPGCPMCNVTDHALEICPNFKWLNFWTVARLLFIRRGGKCMIRTNLDVFKMAKDCLEQHRLSAEGYVPPWTREFALQTRAKSLEKLVNWSYTPDPTLGIHADPGSSWERILGDEPPNGSFQHWMEAKHAAKSSGNDRTQPDSDNGASSTSKAPPAV